MPGFKTARYFNQKEASILPNMRRGEVKGQNLNFHSCQPLHFEKFELRMCACFFHFWPPSVFSSQISISTNERPVFGHKSISVNFGATKKLFS